MYMCFVPSNGRTSPSCSIMSTSIVAVVMDASESATCDQTKKLLPYTTQFVPL